MYKYEDLKKNGYILTKINKKDLKYVFKRRTFNWSSKVDVWHNTKENKFIIEEYQNIYYIWNLIRSPCNQPLDIS